MGVAILPIVISQEHDNSKWKSMMQPVWNFGFCNIVSLLFPILYDHPDHSRMRFYSCFVSKS